MTRRRRTVEHLAMLATLLVLLVFCGEGHAGAQVKSTDADTTSTASGEKPKSDSQGQGRTVGSQGRYLARTKVMDVTAREREIAAAVKSTMKEEKSESASGEEQGPTTIEDAAALLAKRIAMAAPPSKCFEYEGMFYFSGGTSATPVDDFNSGFAVRKGSTAIFRWEPDAGLLDAQKVRRALEQRYDLSKIRGSDALRSGDKLELRGAMAKRGFHQTFSDPNLSSPSDRFSQELMEWETEEGRSPSQRIQLVLIFGKTDASDALEGLFQCMGTTTNRLIDSSTFEAWKEKLGDACFVFAKTNTHDKQTSATARSTAFFVRDNVAVYLQCSPATMDAIPIAQDIDRAIQACPLRDSKPPAPRKEGD